MEVKFMSKPVNTSIYEPKFTKTVVDKTSQIQTNHGPKNALLLSSELMSLKIKYEKLQKSKNELIHFDSSIAAKTALLNEKKAKLDSLQNKIDIAAKEYRNESGRLDFLRT
jgi:hypothetical protein